MESKSIFAEPLAVSGLDDCHFYHVMEIPGFGVTTGAWDLRQNFKTYFGHYDFAGKRVLEIGPASGFLTFEMEKCGAEVVSVEVQDQHLWDYVPYPDEVMASVHEPRREHMRKLKNSFWLAHRANQSRARVYYGNVYDMPDAIGKFDVAVMAAVLLHVRDPVQVIAQCAKRAKTLIVVDMFYPEIEGAPVCRLVPTRDNHRWDTWWNFSTGFFRQFLAVLGFPTMEICFHTQVHYGKAAYSFFTIVASR